MANALVDCSVHGITEGWGISFGPNTSFISNGNIATCAKCGSPAPMIDGVYETDGAGSVRANLWLTDDQFDRLHAALRRARELAESGQVKDKVVARRLRQELDSAEISFLERHFPRDKRLEIATWIGIVLALLALMQPNGESEGSEIVEQQDKIIQQQGEMIDRYQQLVDQALAADEGGPSPPQLEPKAPGPVPQPSGTSLPEQPEAPGQPSSATE